MPSQFRVDVDDQKYDVVAESASEAACKAVGVAYHDQRVPSETSVVVENHGSFRVTNRRSTEYSGETEIDVSDLTAEPVE